MVRFGSKSIDFVAAVLTGLGVWGLSTSGIPSFLRPHLFSIIVEGVIIKVGAFALAALVVFLWRHQLRVRFGWVLIACLGIVITAVVDELVLRANDLEPDAFDAFSPFPLEILLSGITALIFMAAAHYAGVLLLQSKRP